MEFWEPGKMSSLITTKKGLLLHKTLLDPFTERFLLFRIC